MNALVVGGNCGIGLSIVSNLLLFKGYEKIYVVGKDDIDYTSFDSNTKKVFSEKIIFFKENLVSSDFSFLNNVENIESLFVTIGFGRATLFENLLEPEIENLIKVNLVSVIRIIKHFYPLIKSQKDFFTSIMVSICGRIVSPFFSVYGASKGGLRFFIENINCELEATGFKNRVLEVSPGSLKGTSFNGGKTDLAVLDSISNEIIERTFKREVLYIPQLDEIYKNVINKYHNDSYGFGLDSYKYKEQSGRISNKPQLVVGFLSGTFDLFHIGHLNLLKRAKKECDYLIVSVHNSGAWKGKETFIPYEERKAIVQSIKYVDKVVDDFLEDTDAWDIYHYQKLFVGSDYKGTERFKKYEEFLKGKAEIVYFPYTQGTSSTQLRDRLKAK